MAEGSWCVSFWAGSGVVGHRLFCANLLTAHALGADIPLLTQQSLKEPANTHTHAKTHTYLQGIGPFPWLSVTFSRAAEITSCTIWAYSYTEWAALQNTPFSFTQSLLSHVTQTITLHLSQANCQTPCRSHLSLHPVQKISLSLVWDIIGLIPVDSQALT